MKQQTPSNNNKRKAASLVEDMVSGFIKRSDKKAERIVLQALAQKYNNKVQGKQKDSFFQSLQAMMMASNGSGSTDDILVVEANGASKDDNFKKRIHSTEEANEEILLQALREKIAKLGPDAPFSKSLKAALAAPSDKVSAIGTSAAIDLATEVTEENTTMPVTPNELVQNLVDDSEEESLETSNNLVQKLEDKSEEQNLMDTLASDIDMAEDLSTKVPGFLQNPAEWAEKIVLEALAQKIKDQGRQTDFGRSLRAIVNDPNQLQSVSSSDDDDEDSVSDATPTDAWSIKFQELRQYRILYGNCKVPQNFKSNPKLGKWVGRQRNNYRLKKLRPDRIAKLDSLGMFWGKNYPPPITWDEQFEELSRFRKAMGHCNVSFDQTNPSPLAKWCAQQRTEYRHLKKGREHLITMEQVEALNGIGFHWKGPRL